MQPRHIMRPRAFLAAALGAAALAALLAGAQSVRHWVAEDPRFCASCHHTSPDFALWSSSHRELACQKCHHSSASQAVFMLRSYVAGGTPGRGSRHGPLEIGACASCHEAHDRRWAQVGASRGHRLHAIEQQIACATCHGGGVHRFAPAAAACRGCHGERATARLLEWHR